jgi:hypothetical protein
MKCSKNLLSAVVFVEGAQPPVLRRHMQMLQVAVVAQCLTINQSIIVVGLSSLGKNLEIAATNQQVELPVTLAFHLGQAVIAK